MKYFRLTIFMVLCAAILHSADSMSQEYYSKGHYRLIRSNPNVPLVSGIDVEKMMGNYLENFTFVKKQVLGYDGRRYLYTQNKAQILATVGVHTSITDVEEGALSYLNGISAAMQEGPFRGETVGDSMWWYPDSFGPEQQVQTVLFIRKNVFIILNTREYQDVLALAQKIDADILNGSPYVIITENYSPPVIKEIILQKSSIYLGEATKFTVSAIDPTGGILEYCGFVSRIDTDPVNVFTITTSKYDSPGEFSFPVWVINQRDALSLVVRIKITLLAPSSVSDETSAKVPQDFTLFQNAPNPFNPSTVIGFELSSPQSVRLVVYSAAGQKVRELASGHMSAGGHSVVWDGRDDAGMPVSSGVYLCRLEAGGRVVSVKMLLMR